MVKDLVVIHLTEHDFRVVCLLNIICGAVLLVDDVILVLLHDVDWHLTWEELPEVLELGRVEGQLSKVLSRYRDSAEIEYRCSVVPRSSFQDTYLGVHLTLIAVVAVSTSVSLKEFFS